MRLIKLELVMAKSCEGENKEKRKKKEEWGKGGGAYLRRSHQEGVNYHRTDMVPSD